MQKYADPLGIERIIAETQAELEQFPSQDDFDTWNQHPITIRMKKAMALDMYRRNQQLNLEPNPELTAYVDGLINYGIADGVEE